MISELLIICKDETTEMKLNTTNNTSHLSVKWMKFCFLILQKGK